MELSIHGAPIYFTIPILGGIPISATLLVTWGVMILLTGLSIWLTHDLKVSNISKKQAVAEKLVMMAEGLVRDNMGEKWMAFVPLITALFALSIFCSLSSLIGLFPPTGDISTTLAWGLLAFVLITYYKIKAHGFGGYLKGFCDPIFLMAPFNVLGELFRPVSMAFRHYGNIISGTVIAALIYWALALLNHLVFSWLPGAVGYILGNIPFLSVGIPAILSLYFDWFGGFMQAFIFCMLTMMFIATAED